MGRPTKSGKAPLNRTAVDWKAKTHDGFANELRAVIAEAIKAIPPVPTSTHSPGTPHVALNELREAFEYGPLLAECHAAVLQKLVTLSEGHRRLARLCGLVSEGIRPGRPAAAKSKARQRLGMLASAQPRRKPGRPKALYAGFDDDAFQEVEQARTSLAAMGKPSTIKAGIRFILDDLARATGAGMWRHEDGAYGRLRAAYGRGKRRAAKA